MDAPFVPAELDALLDPDGAPWRRTRPTSVALTGTPLGLQPTGAVRVAWTGRRIGAVERVAVSALHQGEFLAFRLEWSDDSESRAIVDTTSFPDAAALLLPATPASSAVTMGAPGAAVNAWYWRADEEHGRHVVAEGIGTSRTLDLELVRGRGVWKERRWRVVLARALRVATADPVAQLAPGERTGFALAVWEGSNGERAGIKAFSGDWRELRLGALPSARR
jgi:complex iron-sulfur molybdoenzyme family reductase subunit gamma